jgi:DNA-binding response OmpR family regulator
MKRILIIEDDQSIREGLKAALEEDAYDVLTSPDGKDGLTRAKSSAVDLIILDIVLPYMNGLEVCKNLRSEGINTPVMMLTSKTEEIDIVLGLEVGADDYQTKPFSLRELKARIKALLRRTGELTKGLNELRFGDVYLDFEKQEARKGMIPLRLSTKEFQIMKHLGSHEGKVISRDDLLDAVWGYESFPSTRTVDNYILSLRKKIETDPSEPRHLVTVHTAGYKFVADSVT